MAGSTSHCSTFNAGDTQACRGEQKASGWRLRRRAFAFGNTEKPIRVSGLRNKSTRARVIILLERDDVALGRWWSNLQLQEGHKRVRRTASQESTPQ